MPLTYPNTVRIPGMSALVYRRPLSEGNQNEFNGLDLRGTKQDVVKCANCQAEYVLLYPDGAGDELLARYRHEVTANMRNCAKHISRMEFKF
jgi:hypothetical protein